MSSAYAVIRDAIRDKTPIAAMYRGHRRELCPHAVGWKDERRHVLCYQFGGHSSKGLEHDGSPENWRCMFVDEMTRVEAIEGDWHTADWRASVIGQRMQRCIDDIEHQVEF